MPSDADRRKLISRLNAQVQRVTGLPGTDSEGWRRMFAVYDKNADGLVTSKELNKLLSDAGVGTWLTRGDWVNGVIKAMDADGDKGISLSELMTAVAKMPAPASDAPVGEPDVALPIQSTASMRRAESDGGDDGSGGGFWAVVLGGVAAGLLLRVFK